MPTTPVAIIATRAVPVGRSTATAMPIPVTVCAATTAMTAGKITPTMACSPMAKGANPAAHATVVTASARPSNRLLKEAMATSTPPKNGAR